MKKVLFFILAAALLLTSCSRDRNPDKAEAAPAVTTVATEAPATEAPATEAPATEAPAAEETAAEAEILPLPQQTMEFSFMSGAGGWRTVMTLSSDGSFTGMYTDSEMGDVGDGYPYGSVYICAFSGKFENIAQVDAYSYKMTLGGVQTENPIGEEWIEEEIRYVAAGPFGLNDTINNQECTDFVFYLPNTPIDQVPEDFLFWWPYQYSEEEKTTLSSYGILNVTTNDGFFSAEA